MTTPALSAVVCKGLASNSPFMLNYVFLFTIMEGLGAVCVCLGGGSRWGSTLLLFVLLWWPQGLSLECVPPWVTELRPSWEVSMGSSQGGLFMP